MVVVGGGEPCGKGVTEKREENRTVNEAVATGDARRAEQPESSPPPRSEARFAWEIEWVVVAEGRQLARAQELLGTEVRCSWCGRRGMVVRVVRAEDLRSCWKPSAQGFVSGVG